MLAALAPFLVVADTWLTLVAGRELVAHGLPREDALTVLGGGSTWTDQQWLAQLALYGLERAGGLGAVSLAGGLLTLGALGLGAAAARARGASVLATIPVVAVVAFAAPWAWQVRAQSLALPLFVAVLWLLVDARAGARPRTLLAIPLLAAWANVHGSVVLGAGLALLLALLLLARRAGPARLAAALALLAPLAVLVTPYGPWAIVEYYRLLLVDPPFGDLIVEWKWAAPAGRTALFYVLAGIALLAVARRPRALTGFELAVLALTFAGGVSAIRGVVWFALACLVLLPVAVGGGHGVRAPRRADRVVAATAVALVAAASASLLVRAPQWLEREWPEQALPVLRQELAAPATRLWPSDRHADWLLWRLPELRGRIAYDVRFELLSRAEIERIARFAGELGPDWRAAVAPYEVVVLDLAERPSHRADLLAEPGAREAYRDELVSVVVRRPA